MSSLETLRVSRCKNLRHVTCLRHLTSLKRLNIVRCTMLEEILDQSSRADRSQWPKIYHIPNVSVNYHERYSEYIQGRQLNEMYEEVSRLTERDQEDVRN